MENSAKLTDNSLFKVIYSTKRKIETTREDWVHDIPFILIPSELIAGFRDQRFTFEEFYSSDEWSLPNHWNAALVKDGKIVVFIYGRFSILEKDLHMIRLGADPSFQNGSNHLIQLVLDEVETIARRKGLEYIWTVTDRKGLDRKRAGRGMRPTNKFVLENDKF